MKQVVFNRALRGALALMLLGASAAYAKPKLPVPSSLLSMDQMDIVAQTTEYNGQAHTYTVRGGVLITLRDMTVTCDQATIFDTPKEDRVDRIVFSGNVAAKRGSGTFRGEKVTYFVAERRLLAEGGTHARLMVPSSGAPAGRLLHP